MLKLDHLRIPVTDLVRSRRWHVEGLFTIFLQQSEAGGTAAGCALWFQVVDVDATFAEWSARGVQFTHRPEKTSWGYGAELRDPDGRAVRLWDETSMKAR